MIYVYEFNFYNKAGTLVLQVAHEASSLIEALQNFVMPKDDVLYSASAVSVRVIQRNSVGE